MMRDSALLTIPEVLNLLGGKKSTESESQQSRSKALIRIHRMNDVFPNFALVGPLESLLSLSTTAAVAARNCFPVSSFAHVFDEFAFGRSFDPRPVQPPQDDLVARMGAFLSVGELFAYLNEDRPAPPSAIVTQYSRTLAYAVSRADIVWPKLDKEIIFQRWFEVRRLTGWAANELLIHRNYLRDFEFGLRIKTPSIGPIKYSMQPPLVLIQNLRLKPLA